VKTKRGSKAWRLKISQAVRGRKAPRPARTRNERIAFFESRLKLVAKQGRLVCKIWQGSKCSGYGTIAFPNLFQGDTQYYHYTHIVAFYIAGRGNELTKAKPFVLHKYTCDRACCEETHLYAGSAQDNMDDMVRADRQSSGTRHYTYGRRRKNQA